jgi:hypothetical protein
MARFEVKEGHHYHGMPPLSTLPWIGEKTMARYVTFSPECRYDSAPYNSQDVNKLFGLSFGFGGVHGNSARFGWRWSNGDQCIELLAYVYKDGVRNWDEQMRFPVVAQIGLGERVECSLVASSHKGQWFYIFKVKRVHEIFDHTTVANGPDSLPGFGLTHGLYFGGSMACPHTMTVEIDRV